MWVQNTRRQDLISKETDYLHANCYLCSEHFEVGIICIMNQFISMYEYINDSFNLKQ